ncbi:MAG TPA: acyl-CoA-binding protein [Cyclobacteriaceae bacterium]|jgi:acyl-CoA-binding protein|nr:acyl-CoA-binding protein [Cyclobacteriaceae bacterium]
MALPEDFRAAQARSREFTKRPSNEELLTIYALFKQATEGDVVGDRPGGFDFKAIAKHDAWTAQKGKSTEQAMQDYVDLINRLEKEYR